MNTSRITYLILAVWLAMASCGGSKGTVLDDPTSGNIHITVDESYQPLMEAEIEVFESLYPHAKVRISYTDEATAFADLLADSSRFIVVNRELNEKEMEYFKKIELTPRTIPMAYDGLAFIVNKECSLKKLLYGQVGDIFSGKLITWDQLSSVFPKDSIRIIFDHPASGNVRMIRERFNLGEKLPANCFAVNSNPEVISYVQEHPLAIGVISVNWISDEADSNTVEFLKNVNVLSVGGKMNTDTTADFYAPIQGYIAADYYPFKRTAYIISREARAGLGTGFASFITGDKGQRIVLRSGMVPATAPVRIVEVTNE